MMSNKMVKVCFFLLMIMVIPLCGCQGNGGHNGLLRNFVSAGAVVGFVTNTLTVLAEKKCDLGKSPATWRELIVANTAFPRDILMCCGLIMWSRMKSRKTCGSDFDICLMMLCGLFASSSCD